MQPVESMIVGVKIKGHSHNIRVGDDIDDGKLIQVSTKCKVSLEDGTIGEVYFPRAPHTRNKKHIVSR